MPSAAISSGLKKVVGVGVVAHAELGDVLGRVAQQAVVLDGALEDRAEVDEQLVDGAAGEAALVDEFVAPLLDLVGGDLLDALALEGGVEVGVDVATVVRQR